MKKSPVLIIIVIIIMISFSSEFASMAKQIGFRDALLSLAFLVLLILGLRYLIRRSRKGMNKPL